MTDFRAVFPPYWRQEALSRAGETFDLLIIGGGITGCGILFDAAQRGLAALLVERGDLASGTSSRSSKLVHGGLRYLRQGRLRLTRLSCRERDRLGALNPLLVEPIPFLYPVQRGDRLPAWAMGLGLAIYDRLGDRPAARHRRVPAAEAERLAPGLARADLAAAFLYSDARTDDARLTLAVAATGLAWGGRILSRVEVLAARRGAGGRIQGVVARDLETGTTLPLAARVVINAAGVWVDRVREAFGLAGRRLRPSRGSHLVLPPGRLPLAAAIALPSPDDGRPVFLIPHPEGVLVGTTDLYHDGGLDDPRPSAAERTYLLRAVQRLFPASGIGPADIVGSFAGLRPILDTAAADPARASRDEGIWEEDGLLSVAGGKLTTWRVMAEEAVDQALRRLPRERAARAGRSATAGIPLAGAAPADLAARLTRTHGLDPAIAAGMARRLRGAAAFAPRLARGREELEPLAEGSDLTAAEVRAHLAGGAVLRLEDLLLRRVRLGLWDPDAALRLLPRLRPLCEQELGWDAARWGREEAAAAAALDNFRAEGVA